MLADLCTQSFLLLLMVILTKALLSPLNIAIRSRNVVKNNQVKSQQTWNVRRHCIHSHVCFCFIVFIFSRFSILKWKRYQMLKILIIYFKLKHTDNQNLILVFSSILMNIYLLPLHIINRKRYMRNSNRHDIITEILFKVALSTINLIQPIYRNLTNGRNYWTAGNVRNLRNLNDDRHDRTQLSNWSAKRQTYNKIH